MTNPKIIYCPSPSTDEDNEMWLKADLDTQDQHHLLKAISQTVRY